MSVNIYFRRRNEYSLNSLINIIWFLLLYLPFNSDFIMYYLIQSFNLCYWFVEFISIQLIVIQLRYSNMYCLSLIDCENLEINNRNINLLICTWRHAKKLIKWLAFQKFQYSRIPYHDIYVVVGYDFITYYLIQQFSLCNKFI